MKILIGSLVSLVIGSSAMASFDLASNAKKIVCYADDSQSWVLNAKRTTVDFDVEGEGHGPQKILKTESDNSNFVSYTTSEGTLTLSDMGDFFLFNGEPEPAQIRCQ